MRNESRYPIRSAMRLKAYDAETNYLVGYVADLSMQGLRVITDASMDLGTLTRLRLQMRLGTSETLKFELLVNVQWSRQSSEEAQFETGFRVLSPSAELDSLVQRLKRKHED